MDPVHLSIIFIILWLITFIPAWYLLFQLLAMTTVRLGLKFWLTLLLYRLVIALPYLVLLGLGKDVLPDIIEILIIGFILTGALLSVIRFLFREKTITFLWWLYGLTYDGLNNFIPYKRLITKMITLAKAEKPQASNILEVGCGTGNVIGELLKEYPSAHITGVDNSSTMLTRSIKKWGHLKNTSFVKCDAIEFLQNKSEKTYDVIIMQNVLYAISDHKILWQELVRVLTDDGVIIVTNSDREGSGTIIKEHLRYGNFLTLLHPKLIMVGIIDSYISQMSKNGSFQFIHEEAIRLQVNEAGAEMSATNRCYGDVNIIFSVSKKSRGKPA